MGTILNYKVRDSKETDTAGWSKTIDSSAESITGNVRERDEQSVEGK
jgi:hypothetical protein